MNCLPSGDRTTQRSELAVFASLGLAGVMVVLLAVSQTSRFVADSDRIGAALAGRPASPLLASPADDSQSIVTNKAAPGQYRAAASASSPGEV